MEEVCLEMDFSCGSLHQTHSKAPAFRLSFFFFFGRPLLSLNQIILPLCFITTGSCVLLCANIIEPRWGNLLNVEFARSRFTDSCICFFLPVLANMLMFALSTDRCQGANCVSLSSKVKPWAQSVDKRTAWNGHPKIRRLDLGWQTVIPQTGCVSVQCRNQIWSAHLVT